MKIAIIVFVVLALVCLVYAPFVMSGKLSDQERKEEKDRASKGT